jgi:S1-C subfamily serine protease
VTSRRAALALAGAAVLVGCGAGGSGGGGESASGPPAVLQVSVPEGSGPASVATAFATDDGRAVTVAHAVAGHRIVLVAAPGGRAQRTRVLQVDERRDLALLAVPGLRAPTMRTAQARPGEAAHVLVVRNGHARSLPATVRRLITARVREAPDAAVRIRPALELDATVMQGDSGAPVIDAKGRVIGTLFAQASARDDRAYAVAGPTVSPPLTAAQ